LRQPGKHLHHGFQKGQSGNPAGKPKGARHKTTLMAERLMQDDVENIVNAVLTAARNGDMMAAKIILDRIAPVRRSRATGWRDGPACVLDEGGARPSILRPSVIDAARPEGEAVNFDCA
jgi:hypothetical protein